MSMDIRSQARLPEANWEWLRAKYMAKYLGLLYSCQIRSCQASASNRFLCALLLHNHDDDYSTKVERDKNAHKRRMQIPSRLKTCLAMADTSHIVSGIYAKSVVTAKHVVVTRHSQNCGHKRGAYQRQFTKLCTKCRPNTPQKVPTPSLYRWTINEPSMNHMHLPKTKMLSKVTHCTGCTLANTV